MRCTLVSLATLAACGHRAVDDCAVVRDRPGQAMAELSRRYPGDPVKATTVIEGCVAPTGEPCDRIAKLVQAIPQMMPTPLKVPDKAAEVCRSAPPELQRCLLPSYMLAHKDECTKLTTGELRIDLPATPRRPGVHSCKDHHLLIDIVLDEDGLWLATGTSGWCFAAKTHEGYDYDWLEHELRSAHVDSNCGFPVELAAYPGVRYEDVMGAMDAALRIGEADIGMSDPGDLETKAPRDRKTATAHCAKPELVANGSDMSAVRSPGSAEQQPSGIDSLAKAPVVVITRTDIELRVPDQPPKPIAEVVALPAEGGTIAELAAALPGKPASNLVILQVNKAIDAGLVTRVISTLKKAGYDNVMFMDTNR